MISRRRFLATLSAGLLTAPLTSEAQPPAMVPRIGVLLPGGPFYAVVEGLRTGLGELRLEEGKQFTLEIRDLKGDVKAAGQAARGLEREKVKMIYTIGTTVTLPAKRATTEIPVVFNVGRDPIDAGLVESFAKPGGRLTGVHYLTRDLTAKRLEILKEMLPKLRRVVTFYDPDNPSAQASAKFAREAAHQLGIDLVERQVPSVRELQEALKTLKAGEADAYLYVQDGMVMSQAQQIIDTGRAKKLPTMFHETSIVAKGALVSYGVSYREVGRLSAKYVQRILAGTAPRDLPVESIDHLELVINLRTAKALGLTIPRSVLALADEVIQ